jgi:alpha-L-fucosidase
LRKEWNVKYFVALGLTLTLCTLAVSQTVAPTAGGPPATQPIPYATIQHISPDDSPAVIAEKAAKVLPSPRQTAWMRLEREFFIHFGPNAFRGVEWGTGRESPSVFDPTALDTAQWVAAIKDGGGKLIIPVVKHHDGFCLWPSRYTDHSVASSPWLSGKGDVFRGVTEAAQKEGIKMAFYLSPADLYQLKTNPTNPAGYYGNGSPKVKSVIPTDPASFKSDPAKGRTPPQGFKSYTYEVDDYNRYFLNQLYELLTDYGPISEVWFDGANPDRSVPETYDYAAWYDMIHQLRPDAVIAVKGPDVRWVGNEGGNGRTTEWSVLPIPKPPEEFLWPDQGGRDLGSRSKLTPGSYLVWYPAETNVPILNGWFWAANKRPRTAAELVDLYYQSVGRNGNSLINLSPDNRGLIPDNQVAPLRLSAQVISDTFAKNLAAGGTVSADNSNPANNPALTLDGDLDTWWEAAAGQTTPTLTLKLPSPVTFDVISLQEAVDHRSQRIESFIIETWNGTEWTACPWIRGEETTTVGHKRLLRMRTPVTTDQVRIRITASRLEPTLAEIGLFKQAEMVQPPVISNRDINGVVTLSDPKGLTVVYTTDCSMPTARSPVYKSPIDLPQGGTVNAACLGADGRIGMMATKLFSGLAPKGWKIVSDDAAEAANAAKAIDGDPATFYQLDNTTLPHSLTVDMGRELKIAGFSYLPRPERNATGLVDTYRFETSTDGKTWTTAIDQARFGNIRNNPVLQEVNFSPVNARFFRFTAVREASGNNAMSVAEITVLPATSAEGKNP